MVRRSLKGSPSRDIFKWKHKQLNRKYYAIDLDFVLIEKNPPGIVAFIDFKLPGDCISFAEALAYNHLVNLDKIPIYIIESGSPEDGPFTIRRYLGADWKPEPPLVEWGNEYQAENWYELEQFEMKLRQAYHRRRERNTEGDEPDHAGHSEAQEGY